MTNDCLAALLAQHFLKWRVGPDRFLTGGRQWIPRWRFQPEKNLNDAGRLLDAAAPTECTMCTDKHGCFKVCLQINGAIGEARDRSKARAITYALARAIGIKPDGPDR